jgi:hypothetical protein
MTQAEKNLLVLLAKQRVAELKMTATMFAQEMGNPDLPDDQKAFLFMQRGQIAAAAEETEKALMEVQKEGQLVIG